MKVATDQDMQALGERLGRLFKGGEVIELIGDVGTGKTTLVKGIGRGLEIDEDIQSPTFTLERQYQARDGLELHHYDFYRLNEPGVVAYELAESIADPAAITIVEWGESVDDVLPVERLSIELSYLAEDEGRDLKPRLPDNYQHLKEAF